MAGCVTSSACMSDFLYPARSIDDHYLHNHTNSICSLKIYQVQFASAIIPVIIIMIVEKGATRYRASMELEAGTSSLLTTITYTIS